MIDPVEPRCFTWDALAELRATVESVDGVDAFLDEADRLLTVPEATLALPFATGGLPELSTEGERDVYEVQNAKALYTSLGAMPPIAGADPRLWTWLALGPYRDYMMSRWSLRQTRNWRGRVADRWILPAGTASTGKLMGHGLARLWWLADLTHPNTAAMTDEDDEWRYLRVALSKEDFVTALFERETGAIPSLRFALLDEFETWDTGAGDKAKRIMKEVTLSHGYKDLSWLSRVESQTLVRELAALIVIDGPEPIS